MGGVLKAPQAPRRLVSSLPDGLRFFTRLALLEVLLRFLSLSSHLLLVALRVCGANALLLLNGGVLPSAGAPLCCEMSEAAVSRGPLSWEGGHLPSS